jgi:ElaB/YqjD/DUF883 family membrane-anchored ribosome-binding protein
MSGPSKDEGDTAAEAAHASDLHDAETAKPLDSGAQGFAGRLKEKAADLQETISEAAGTAGQRAKGVYAQAAGQYEIAAGQVDPFVRERPYTAIGLAAAAGLLAGLLWAGRGSNVVYLKSRP